MPTGVPATSAFMPSTSLDLLTGVRNRAELWLYRIGGYLLLNVVDDPAWLALMFC